MPADRAWIARYNPDRRIGKSRSTWGTPWDLFDAMSWHYNPDNPRTIDLAADSTNTKCERFFGLNDPNALANNSMSLSWKGEHGFLNPPFGSTVGQYTVHDWINKTAAETVRGMLSCILVLPGEFDQPWFETLDRTAKFIDLVGPRISFIGSTTSNPSNSIFAYYENGHSGGATIRPLNWRRLVARHQSTFTIGVDARG